MTSLINAAYAATYDGGDITNPTNFGSLGDLIASVLQVGLWAGGIAAFGFLLVGGVQFITSGGDKLVVERAQKTITYALIGLAIIAGSVAIALILEAIFGIPILKSAKIPTP